jgi:hypothetical protein
MSILIIGSVLAGAILGRFFKVLALLPVSAFVLVVVLVRTAYFEHGLLHMVLEFGVLTMSLQIGYFANLALSVTLQRGIRRSAHPRRALHRHDGVGSGWPAAH